MKHYLLSSLKRGFWGGLPISLFTFCFFMALCTGAIGQTIEIENPCTCRESSPGSQGNATTLENLIIYSYFPFMTTSNITPDPQFYLTEVLFFEGTYSTKYDLNEIEPDLEASQLKINQFWSTNDHGTKRTSEGIECEGLWEPGIFYVGSSGERISSIHYRRRL